MKIHPLADVQTSNIGADTTIWQFAIVLKGATIGKNCNINCHTFIENDVTIGDNVTIKSGVYLWDGTIIEDNVFVGPNVTFTNDKYPRSKMHHEKYTCATIRGGASIGAGAIVLGGVEIGAYALVGAGSLVTKNVPAHAIAYGSPAEIMGWVDEMGRKLTLSSAEGVWASADGKTYKIVDNKLLPI